MDLKRKKLEVELMKVNAAQGDMELNILKHMDDIERIEKNIVIQKNRAKELEEMLKEKSSG